MNYECVSARFLFFNGKENLTVEYTYGISTWFVFKDQGTSNALWSKKINPAKRRTPNRNEAADILDEYLEEITSKTSLFDK